MKDYWHHFIHKREFIIPILCVLLDIMVYGLAYTLQISGIDMTQGSWVPLNGSGTVITVLNHAILMLVHAFIKYPVDICMALATFGAITASVVILFYSLFDAKNLGITHRLIMNYCVGSFTIPVSFMLMLIKVCVLYIAACNEKSVFISVLAVYIWLQEFFIITVIMISTSCNFNVRMIARQEAWQYRRRKKLDREEAGKFDAWKTPHAVYAIKSGDTFMDRMKLITRILMVPVHHCKHHYKGRNKADKSKWECADMYDYYFEQVCGMFEILRDRQEERIKFYEVLYEILLDIKTDDKLRELQKGEDAERYKYLLNVVCGAIMNAAITTGLPDTEAFCTQILNRVFDDNERNRQITLYFLMWEMNLHISSNGERSVPGDPEQINGFEKWSIEEDDIDSMTCFWKLMSDWMDIENDETKKYYDNFINTYAGIGTSSVVMVYFLAKKKVAEGR